MKKNVINIILYIITHVLLIPLMGSVFNSNAALIYFLFSFLFCLYLIYNLGIENVFYLKGVLKEKYIFVSIILIGFNLIISSVLIIIFNETFGLPLIFQSHVSIYFILSILVIPITEEILWKYCILKNTLFLSGNMIMKMVLIGALFALLHCFGFNSIYATILSFSYYFIYYVTTSYLYTEDNNIGWVIIIHSICNLAACLFSI